MGSEVALRGNAGAVLADLQWARTIAQAGIVPAAYQGRPGNLIVAAQLGRALGIHPMVAVNQIYIVDGKPSTSSLLIGALVRNAGHKIRITANNDSATVVIIRKDDPEFEYKVTWRLKKGSHNDPSGEQAGLLQKDNWKKYSASMLYNRALTQCARMACGEALLGVGHTTEELAPDMSTDEFGGVMQAERISFEDMYAEQIRNAVTTEELKRYHQEAKATGVLKVIPTGEERTVLKMLNDRMREIKDQLPEEDGEEENDRSEGQSGADVSKADNTEASAGTGQDYLNKPDTGQDDPAYDGVMDAEIVADDGNGHSIP